MWKSRGGYITNGKIRLKFAVAWDYIVNQTKPKTKLLLGIDDTGYHQFRAVVYQHLSVPRYLCGGQNVHKL